LSETTALFYFIFAFSLPKNNERGGFGPFKKETPKSKKKTQVFAGPVLAKKRSGATDEEKKNGPSRPERTENEWEAKGSMGDNNPGGGNPWGLLV